MLYATPYNISWLWIRRARKVGGFTAISGVQKNVFRAATLARYLAFFVTWL